MQKSIKILGEDWLVKSVPKEKMLISNCDGYEDSTIREIVVEDMKAEEGTVQNMLKYKNSVIRHEVIHAFLDESGLQSSCSWARNEEMIDYFAIQFPKILKVFTELEVLE